MTKAELEFKDEKRKEQLRRARAKFKQVGANIRIEEYKALEERLNGSKYKNVSDYVKSLLNADKGNSDALVELKRIKPIYESQEAVIVDLKAKLEEVVRRNGVLAKELEEERARSWWSRLWKKE